mmetsp:Transcript_39504/g.62717  ORF Transcript_39504/g.62717 Transcript_39504/m.62717 type:complete len:928 (+) Transcript_39504:71-2854(+)
MEPRKYDEFKGRVILVDLYNCDWETGDFEGRDWLEWRTREKLPIGWDLEWQPDRSKAADNPIALMQFGDENTCLLVRTIWTRSWLPDAIRECLLSEDCKKIGVGWDGPDKTKMQLSFGMQPNGIVDLAAIAKEKGLKEQGLKALCYHFGYMPRKDTKVARSNWACRSDLSPAQIQYAAEDAYFTYILYDKLLALPDVDPEYAAMEKQGLSKEGILTMMKKEWEAEGIVQRADGLWCSLCDKGPMNMPVVIERHMESARHRKKLQQRNDVYADPKNGILHVLEQRYVDAGIIKGDGVNHPHLRIGDMKCTICDAGPFNNLATVDAHLASKRHMINMEPEPEVVEEKKEDVPKDKFAPRMWNLPDYVTLTGNVLSCRLCPSKANAVYPMYLHLGGQLHARRCRSEKQPEIVYIKLRQRLEVMETGKPVLRAGYKVPTLEDQKANPPSGLFQKIVHKRTDREKYLRRRRPKKEAACKYFTKDTSKGKQTPVAEAEQANAAEKDVEEEGGEDEDADDTDDEEGEIWLDEGEAEENDSATMVELKEQSSASGMTDDGGIVPLCLPCSPSMTPPSFGDRVLDQPDTARKSPEVSTEADPHNEGAGPPLPKPSRLPPRAAEESSGTDVGPRSITKDVPPIPAPSRKPPVPPPARVPPSVVDARACTAASLDAKSTSECPSRPRLADVPSEMLSGWSYWTAEAQSQAAPYKAPALKRNAGAAVPLPPARAPPVPKVAAAPQVVLDALPEGWCKHTDIATGLSYYYNLESNTSQWDDPSEGNGKSDVAETAKMPPGWRRAWSSSEGAWYYVDTERNSSQWHPPEPYLHREWQRRIDQSGTRAFWVCSETDYCGAFFETDTAWQRFIDHEGRAYWSCVEKGIRFFERLTLEEFGDDEKFSCDVSVHSVASSASTTSFSQHALKDAVSHKGQWHLWAS